MRLAAVEANSTRPLWAQKGRCGQMGVPGRERPTAGREWGKTVMPCNRLADQRARKGRCGRCSAPGRADGRGWPLDAATGAGNGQTGGAACTSGHGKGRFALADGRPWPWSLIGSWLKCLYDKHEARKRKKRPWNAKVYQRNALPLQCQNTTAAAPGGCKALYMPLCMVVVAETPTRLVVAEAT